MAEEVKNEETKEEQIPSMDDFKEELEESLKNHSAAKRDDMGAWEKLSDDLTNKTPVEVEINGAVKSGVTAELEGKRAFIPASQLSLSFVEEKDLPQWVGKHVTARVITADAEKNRLVLSVKAILREEQEEKRKEKAAEVSVGLVTEGKVETIKDYGAFINIGEGVTGLLHVSQISTKRIKTPADVMKVGDTVKVQVIAVKDGRISLSMKSLAADKAEKEEHRERDNFRQNYKETGAATTSFGDIMKKSGIRF